MPESKHKGNPKDKSEIPANKSEQHMENKNK